MAAATRVTVTTAATPLYTSTSSFKRQKIRLKNTGAVTVELGDAGVTAPTGFDLTAGEETEYDLDPGDVVYGIVASGTAVVEVLAL